MRYFAKAFFGFLVCLIAFSGGAFAKEFSGKIAGINLGQGFLVVRPADQPEKSNRMMMVKLMENTRYDGFQSTKELKVGDEVSFDASPTMPGMWNLHTLRKISPKVPAQPQEVKSSGGGAAMAMGGYSGE